MKATDFRTLAEAHRLAFRKQAIRLIKNGKQKGKVAQIIGIKAGTISAW